MNAQSILEEITTIVQANTKLDLHNRSHVVANLSFLFRTMRASEKLLALAIERLEGADPLLEGYFKKHLEEERGHALWLLEDLGEVCGNSQQAAMLCGSIYYYILHEDPAALLGYMLLMEGNPPSLEAVDTLEKLHGTKLLRTLRYHAEHDKEHSRELKAIVDQLPLERLAYVRMVALNCAYLFGLEMAYIKLRN